MGLLFGRRPERRNADPIAAVWAARKSGTSVVTEEQALRLAAVFACWRIIAGIGSTLPIRQLRGDVPITPSPIWSEPEPQVTLPDWLHRLWISLLSNGNAYGLVLGDQPLVAAGMALVDPARVSWRQVGERVVPHLDGVPQELWPVGPFWHLPLFTRPGTPVGMSPLAAAASAVSAGLATQSWVERWMGRSGAPLSVLRVDDDITQEDADALKMRWLNAVAEDGPVVVTSKVSWEWAAVTPEEAQFLEASRWSAAQVAAVFGVPAEWVNSALSGQSVTYANRESFWQDFLARDLQPMLVRVEAGLSRLLPSGQRVRFNVAALLRADLEARYRSYRVAAEIGDLTGTPLLTVNEMRELEDRLPLDGGDVFARRSDTGGPTNAP